MVMGRCHRHNRAVEFRKFLDAIDNTVPSALDFRPILDNHALRPPGGKVVCPLQAVCYILFDHTAELTTNDSSSAKGASASA